MEYSAVKSKGKAKNGNVKKGPSSNNVFEEKSDNTSWSVNMYLAYGFFSFVLRITIFIVSLIILRYSKKKNLEA